MNNDQLDLGMLMSLNEWKRTFEPKTLQKERVKKEQKPNSGSVQLMKQLASALNN